MRVFFAAGLLLAISIPGELASAQRPSPQGARLSASAPAAGDSSIAVDFNWTPPEFAELSAEATSRSSFSLDRSTLGIAAGLISQSDADARQAINKLDGVSGHILSFTAAGPDDALVAALRQAYHQRGWKHVVLNKTASTADPSAKRPLANGTTDVWVVMDGANLRGAVALVESPRKVTLISLAGNISSVDLLHLRGHFGIPRYDADQLTGQR